VVRSEPHRWANHNRQLGQWLLDIRSEPIDGYVFDFASHTVLGLTFVAIPGPTSLASIANSFRDFGETVVLLDKWPSDIAMHASRLGGSYTVMEDISGNFMCSQLQNLPGQGEPELAWWFARFAKACVIGLSGLDSAVLRRLVQNHGSLTTPGRGLSRFSLLWMSFV
jgi:hypothetical protein